MFIFSKPYSDLLKKYEYFEFDTEDDENEYLSHLIDLINDGSIRFGEKVAILNFMVSGVNAGITPAGGFRMTKEKAAVYLDSIR